MNSVFSRPEFRTQNYQIRDLVPALQISVTVEFLATNTAKVEVCLSYIIYTSSTIEYAGIVSRNVTMDDASRITSHWVIAANKGKGTRSLSLTP
jgi:hypothetical protein